MKQQSQVNPGVFHPKVVLLRETIKRKIKVKKKSLSFLRKTEGERENRGREEVESYEKMT
jgi:hypothetical protein